MLFTLSIWFKRKEHFAGEIQPQMQQEAEIQSTRPHVINCCMSHYVLSPSHLQQYYSQTHGTSDSGGGGSIRSSTSFWWNLKIISKLGQVIWAKCNVVLLSVSLHHGTHKYTQISV